jgi:Tfp pilus assembly protein PilZ
MMGSDMKPRRDRRFKQWNKTTIVSLSASGRANGNSPVEAFTYDLSIGGARIHTEEGFAVGSRIRLQIDLVKTGELLRVDGVVKWKRREENADIFEMGIEFQHTGIATVLSLMRDLHDGRPPAASTKGATAGVSRS